MAKRRVVITGVGFVTSLGEKKDVVWDNIVSGKSGTSRIECFNTDNFPVKIGGEVKGFNPETYIDSREARRIDRFALMALAGAINAMEDSGLDTGILNLDRCGVIIGSGIGGLSELEKEHEKLLKRGPDRVSPFCVPKLMVNAASANVAIKFNFRGFNTSVVTACASATHAIGDAFRHIRNGNQDIMITGGSEAALTQLGLASFCSLKALSRRNDEPDKASRPFDKDRDGFVLAEGAGILILEDLDLARKRGARIYAELAGFGMSCDAEHITAPAENGNGAARAMQEALDDAEVNPDVVDYINAHGTSTELNDISETNAIKKVFGEHAYKLAISSTKSHLGHLLGASGGVEINFAALAVANSVIPPTINLEEADPQCDLDYTPNTAREASIQYALSNSFGFGGHNGSLLIKKFA